MSSAPIHACLTWLVQIHTDLVGPGRSVVAADCNACQTSFLLLLVDALPLGLGELQEAVHGPQVDQQRLGRMFRVLLFTQDLWQKTLRNTCAAVNLLLWSCVSFILQINTWSTVNVENKFPDFLLPILTQVAETGTFASCFGCEAGYCLEDYQLITGLTLKDTHIHLHLLDLRRVWVVRKHETCFKRGVGKIIVFRYIVVVLKYSKLIQKS